MYVPKDKKKKERKKKKRVVGKEIHLLDVSWNIFSVVDATIHGDEFIQGGFLFDTGIVQARIENDDGKRQDVAGICFDGNKSNQFKHRASISKF